MKIEKYLISIPLSSRKIKYIFENKKGIENIDKINELSYNVLGKSLRDNYEFYLKLKEVSDFTWFKLDDINSIKDFFINHSDNQLIDKVKRIIIIYNIWDFLNIYKNFLDLDISFLIRLKIVDNFLNKVPDSDEFKFKVKLFLFWKTDKDIDYIIHLLKYKKDIFKEALLKNKDKAPDIKMKINSRKWKMLRQIEDLEDKGENLDIF